MNSNDVYFYEKYLKPKQTNSDLERVRSWQHEIKAMIPTDEFRIEDLFEICHRFGFYQFHLIEHLIELGMIKRLDNNLFKNNL